MFLHDLRAVTCSFENSTRRKIFFKQGSLSRLGFEISLDDFSALEHINAFKIRV